MKFLITVICIAIFSFLAGLYAPWWSVAIVAFIVSLIVHQKPALSFIGGFLGVFVVWVVLAAIINSSNAGILASKIGGLLSVGNSPAIMILVTGFVGGLVGGFAALAASFLRRDAIPS